MSSPRLVGRHRVGRAAFTLLELLWVVAVLALLLVLALPPLTTWSGSLGVRMAAGEVAGAMRTARMRAIRSQRRVAVKFRTEGEHVTLTLYRDGDGDGVRNDDIDAGIDPIEVPPRRLGHLGRVARFGFPPGPAPYAPGSSKRLDRLDDPIRFNRSDLASFSPRGTATPGSVYLTDGRRHLSVVRVTSRSGKVAVLDYDPMREVWRR
ncbi:MAG: GspH/FimT family pseudopilin [Acidobacteriota bacterium]